MSEEKLAQHQCDPSKCASKFCSKTYTSTYGFGLWGKKTKTFRHHTHGTVTCDAPTQASDDRFSFSQKLHALRTSHSINFE